MSSRSNPSTAAFRARIYDCLAGRRGRSSYNAIRTGSHSRLFTTHPTKGIANLARHTGEKKINNKEASRPPECGPWWTMATIWKPFDWPLRPVSVTRLVSERVPKHGEQGCSAQPRRPTNCVDVGGVDLHVCNCFRPLLFCEVVKQQTKALIQWAPPSAVAMFLVNGMTQDIDGSRLSATEDVYTFAPSAF